MIIPVILAGGSGTRLWPLSRELKPKQFLSLCSEKTMLQETLLRTSKITKADPIVVCSEEHRFLASEQLKAMGTESYSIILEPISRNTAPAIALAAIRSFSFDKDPILLVLPADHSVFYPELFCRAVKRAVDEAMSGRLVTFGIVPNRAETGYGYIELGKEKEDAIYEVGSFVEKPEKAKAEYFVKKGSYLWNSGIFLFKAKTYLDELKTYSPEVFDACVSAMDEKYDDLDFIRIAKGSFERSPNISIDYAVMEKTNISSVLKIDVGWNDIGSWSALWELLPKDKNENVILGDVKEIDTKGCLIRSENRLVASLGIKDIVVVETKDAVLVAHKDRVQGIRKIVDHLKSGGRHEYLEQREVFRPWGSYDSLEKNQRFQVKKIKVKPGAKTSLQLHHHRAEHWVVVSGTAKIRLEEKTFLLSENESTYIPSGKRHSIENPGKIELELIEIQTGSYLGEDDIVRYEDTYGRVSPLDSEQPKE